MVKDSQQLYASYPDLLDEKADVDLVRLVCALDAISAAVQPPVGLRASVERALKEHIAERQEQAVPAGAFLPPVGLLRRLSVVAAALLALVLLAGAAYAVAPILNRAFGMDPGTRQILQSNLGREVNLSQTVDGFTVTIQRVYADANRVVIGYTVSGPPDRTFNSFMFDRPRLSDGEGRALPGAGGLGAGVDTGTGGYLSWFDGSAITGNPVELQLHLEVPSITAIERTGQPPTALLRDPSSPREGVAIAPRIDEASWIHQLTIPGPFDFRFSVPFVPGRVAEVGQTVTANGVPVTLEKVVVSPTETRAYLRVDPPAEIPPEHWSPIARLSVDGWDSRQGERGLEGGGSAGEGRYAYTFSNSLYDKRGEWTLTVEELVGIDPRRFEPEKGIVPQTRVAGPWVFRFTVP